LPKPVVAIVGRPNVGKSTLFNRLTGRRAAIVEEEPGVTRDRLYGEAEWAGRSFTLVDTGGLDFGESDEIAAGVRRQAELAIESADAVLFVVDARTGVTAGDREVAEVLRRWQKPVILVANKVENFSSPPQYYEFYQLGLGEPLPVSAAEGLNTGDLLDRLVEVLPSPKEEGEGEAGAVKIAVVGRPNVGKSSLVNRLLGEERVIVSSVPGTTRDAVDTAFERGGRRYVLIDTAGMRRRSRIESPAEKYSVIRALKAIDRSDVVLLVLDALQGVTDQDKRIAGYTHEAGKALVVVVNKWDLVEKDERTAARYTEDIKEEMPYVGYAPVIFVSALTKRRINRVLEAVDQVAEQHARRLSTPGLNRFLSEVMVRNPPPSQKGIRLKIFYAVQGGTKPPRFVLFVNDPQLAAAPYLRYLENQLRSAYGFEGTPLRFVLKRKAKTPKV